MSSEEQKFAHSKRIHQKDTSVKKQVHIAKEYGIPVDTPHKFAKHHAVGCGNPKCIMCSNPRKTFKELTAQEKRMFQPKLQDEFTHKTDI
jgi:hypothetical protein